MKNFLFYKPRELQTLAHHIQVSPMNWKGIAFYCLSPAKDSKKVSTKTITLSPEDKPLYFRTKNKGLVYLGRPITNIAHLPVTVDLMVPDISQDSDQILEFLYKDMGVEEVPFIPSPSDGTLVSLKVLLVDDDLMTRKMMEGFLSKHVKTLTVDNPQQACANYTVLQPDIVFLDIHYRYEDEDGFDVLRDILSQNPHAHIVMMSGDNTAATVYKSLGKGARGFITKPLRAERFLEHIAKVSAVILHAA